MHEKSNGLASLLMDSRTIKGANYCRDKKSVIETLNKSQGVSNVIMRNNRVCDKESYKGNTDFTVTYRNAEWLSNVGS